MESMQRNPDCEALSSESSVLKVNLAFGFCCGGDPPDWSSAGGGGGGPNPELCYVLPQLTQWYWGT